MLTKSKAIEGPPAAYLNAELLENLQRRLNRVEGHVRGIKKTLANRRDCDDILTQIAGGRAAVNQVAIMLLEGHLDACISEALRAGDGSEPVERLKNSLARALK